MREEEEDQSPTQEEDLLQSLRLRATELLLREQWPESVQAYTHFINLSQHHISNTPKQDDDHHHHHFLVRLRKSLCLAFSNRAEGRSRLKDFDEALKDCEQALRIESTHFKSLVCKGKILMGLNRYSAALDCFKTAVLDPQANGSLETLNGYLEKCRKLEFQSRTGAFDLSEWVLSRFRGKSPELAEYVGAVVIKRSELSGRGLFATKNMDAGTLVLVTKAVATERGILSSDDSSENAQLVMWKNFIEKVVESSAKTERIKLLISTLSTGEDEGELEVPDISLFKPEGEGTNQSNNHEELDKGKILNVLDANSLVEDSVSAKVLGKNSEYYGVGLWLLASFINHSCNPNARRLHIGDHLIVHASRDIKAGEEITFAYFDVLSPLEKRNESSRTWGFHCSCRRCKFEDACSKQEMKEIEIGLERGGMDAGGAIFRIEEGMRRWMVRGKEKGFLRASYWDAYAAEACNGSERSLGKRWILPSVEVVVESVVEATGSDERVMKVWMEGLKRRKTASSMVEMERALKLGRGIYGKVVKKHALKSLLEFGPFMNTTHTCY